MQLIVVVHTMDTCHSVSECRSYLRSGIFQYTKLKLKLTLLTATETGTTSKFIGCSEYVMGENSLDTR